MIDETPGVVGDASDRDTRPGGSGSLAHIAARGAWIAFPLGSAIWLATWIDKMWFVDDEWAMIERATHSGSWLSFDGYGGHLWVLPSLVFRVQVEWIGVQDHWWISFVFSVSLIALLLSIAAVLTRLGVPSVIALLAATVVTFFGPGAQSMTYTAMFASNLALALCFAAAFVALRDEIDLRTALTTTALLLTAFATDSSLATTGVVLVGVLIVLLWPRRLAAIALAVPVAALVAWQLLDHSVDPVAVPFGQSLDFALSLIDRTAAGLVGVTGTSPSPIGPAPAYPPAGPIAGWVALGLGLGCVAFGLARRRLSRKVVASFIGGLLAAGGTVVAITWIRAGLVTQPAGSRFLQQVGVFVLIAFAPAIAASVRPRREDAGRWVGAVAAAGLVVVFVINLGSLWPYRQFWEAWSDNTQASVRHSLAVLEVGCGEGTRPDPTGLPVTAEGSDPSQRITVRLLQHLVERGALHLDFGSAPTQPVQDAICPAASSPVASGSPPG